MPLGSVQHTVAQHWASPRESAEFPTGVKGVVAEWHEVKKIQKGGLY
jgi:hypothetical protein